MWLDEVVGACSKRCPFSFAFDGASSHQLLPRWRRCASSAALDSDRDRLSSVWTDHQTGLSVTCEMLRYSDFPAAEWVLSFEDTGHADTPIIQDVQALDVTLDCPVNGPDPYVLHRTNGAPSNPTDFEMTAVRLRQGDAQMMGGGAGRSSNRDFPFFRVDTGRGTAVVAVGWSGQWRAHLRCVDGARLRVTAGLERTHFRLHPGESVRSPRILLLAWDGEPDEVYSQFRRLIYKHYAARLQGERPAPILYCNTCFTRGGAWLNECNEANQVSLIRALEPLGVQAVVTDAGWFEGGWPEGAGNWSPRKDAYPGGMGPVAGAAGECGILYGLWFEPERVVEGTALSREHPDWLLRKPGDERTALLNFGLPEVQQHFFGVVAGFLKLPGFRVYRQDFNMDPLPYWRENDAPDRQGITEMRYVEGLYAYWDRIVGATPDGVRIECASGGRRIDLETVMRFHVHQKSDYWFDNEVDQASLFSLSQYLPNSLVMAPINRLDDYSFHSAMAASLCLGWIADDPAFDLQGARELTDRYRAVRRLLNGGWYPLTEYNRDPGLWLASQYHDPERQQGLVLAFRRVAAREAKRSLRLRGLEAGATYLLERRPPGRARHVHGAALMEGFEVVIKRAPGSAMICYRKA